MLMLMWTTAYLRETAVRECKEEAGVDISNCRLKRAPDFHSDSHAKHVRFWVETDVQPILSTRLLYESVRIYGVYYTCMRMRRKSHPMIHMYAREIPLKSQLKT